jgi:hypothetical protein
MAGASTSGAVPDSSHVPYLYRGVVFARSFLGWYLAYAISWLAVVAVGLPLAGESAYETYQLYTTDPVAGTLIGAGFALGVFVTLPIAVGTLLQWRRVLTALARDLPRGSPWIRHVVGPLRRAWIVAVAALIVTVVLLGLLFGLVAFLDAAYPTTSYTADLTLSNELGFLALVGMAAAQVATQALTLRSFALLISGSDIPAIDADLRRGVRLALFTAPWIVVPTALFGAITAYSYLVGPTLPYLTSVGLVSAGGLVVSILPVRRAYTRWIALAHRLVGRREMV